MSTKEQYKLFCESQKDIPLFQQYAWYNAMHTDAEWDVALCQKNNNVHGFIPYVLSKKKGFKLISPNFLCPYQGAYINYPPHQKYASKVSFEKEVLSDLIQQLPKTDSFRMNFVPGFNNWLPFYWDGYQQTTRYTYVIEDISDTDAVWHGFKENIRREIRKAEKTLSLEEFDDIDYLFNMKVEVYKNRNETYPIPKERLRAVYDFCKTNNCGELLVAKDESGVIRSVLFLVWDNNTTYYLHGGTNTDYKTDGSMSFLLWNGIKRSKLRTRAFNFEGSMMESIERYFRGFGGTLTPYFQLSKTDSKILRILNQG